MGATDAQIDEADTREAVVALILALQRCTSKATVERHAPEPSGSASPKPASETQSAAELMVQLSEQE
eukprot:SAG11_NODE_5063_length_1676_cov_1.289157_1_plen_66_part_10